MKKSEQLIADLIVIGRIDPATSRLQAAERRVHRFLDELDHWAADERASEKRLARHIDDAKREISFVLDRNQLADPVREVLDRAHELLLQVPGVRLVD